MSTSINKVSRNCQKELQIAAEANTHSRNSKLIMDKLGTVAQSIGKITLVKSNADELANLSANLKQLLSQFKV